MSISSRTQLNATLRTLKRDRSFLFLWKIKKHFPDARAYLVGGIVRDAFLRRPSADYDFVIAGIPARTLQNFLSREGSVNVVGRTFGVLKFHPRGSRFAEPFDIALPRTERSTGGGYRDFVVSTNPELPIEDDLARRDFTINAMAWDMYGKMLIDPWKGAWDLAKKRIRAVGNPEERFKEDATRMLRALRFSAELNFTIVPSTRKALVKHASRIVKILRVGGASKTLVAAEMIGGEFLKTMNANPLRAIKLYDTAGLLPRLLPEIERMKKVPQPRMFHAEGDVFRHTLLALEALPKSASLRLKLATLLHDSGKPQTMKTPKRHGVNRIRFDGHDSAGADIVRALGKRLRWPGDLVREVSFLVQYHMFFVSGDITAMRPRTIKRYFIDTPELGDDLLELYRVDTAASKNPKQKENLAQQRRTVRYIHSMRRAFAASHTEAFTDIITGHDVMKAFRLTPGPKVGEYLGAAADRIVEIIANEKRRPTRSEILFYLKKRYARR